ncbi:AAA family ATPase, partial [Sphingomonas sp. Ant20]|uniref:ATP-binding protein n=1 Tax=Sphingomonas sp. Ant20 TaxID=104605 RepID=UPI0005369DC1
MRIRRLSLERFGRFEGCELAFRSGTPDLHVIYGPNEAGKTTSMAAVSDLLFGFEARSRYNFRFDYPLLRIGAEVEEDGRSLAVRRRKANAGSLVDADDRQMDEGPLLAMLHGQTRERFRLAFSLDHLRLREGGRAIVQARDDVGQALFAAGSGMTDVVDALAALEAEADAIWAPRAARHRTYTQAERSFDASRTAARDRQVRPKAWTDARDAHLAAEDARCAAEAERDALLSEQGRIERLRRIAPAMRRRAELLELLAGSADAKTMPAAREERVVAALDVIAAADRNRAAAATLHAEAQDRLDNVPDDAMALFAADEIDDLAERRGAVTKGSTDLERLTIERQARQARVAQLRSDLGLSDAAPPARPAVARLRERANTGRPG